MRITPAIAMALSCCAGTAWADRPLVSETADVIPEGSCQIEAARLRTTSPGASALRGWDTLLSCNRGLSTQPAVGYSNQRGDDGRSDGLLLGAKTTLVMPEAGSTGLGLAYRVEWSRPPGAAWSADVYVVTAALTRELSSGLLLHGNLGWSRSRPTRQDTTFWSVGMETTADLSMAVDAFGDDRSKPSLSGGVGYVIGAGFSLNASLAVQFETPRLRTLTLGAKLVF
jgi:hypothetical protein